MNRNILHGPFITHNPLFQFIREDLSINDDEQEDQRQLSLHKGDNSISVLDMQKNWLNSRGMFIM